MRAVSIWKMMHFLFLGFVIHTELEQTQLVRHHVLTSQNGALFNSACS